MNPPAKKEEIILDATLENAVECATFQARLGNGHQVVAFTTPKKTLKELGLRPGDRVRVRLSPYDMNKAIILEAPDQENLS